jgi:hypothetical protein
MSEKILRKVVSIIRRMNQWWDKDEEKEISTAVSGVLILLGILILNKGVLFIVAFILIFNRVLHRLNLWTKMESQMSEESTDSSSVTQEDIIHTRFEVEDVKEDDQK